MAKKIDPRIWTSILTPSQDELAYKLDKFVQQGILQPEDVEVFMQEPSLMESFLENPEVISSQLASLNQMNEYGKGNLTPVDKANMMQQMQMEAQQEKGAREAILSNARSRGVAGSGLEMAAALQSQQEAANRANRTATDINSATQQRALQALNQAGSLAGQMRGQDLDAAQRKAAATDAINQFNVQNRQAVTSENVRMANEANARNLAEQQRVADQNVGMTNEQRRIAAEAAQQRFQNEATKVGGATGVMQSNLSAKTAEDAAKKGAMGDALGAIGTVVGAIYGGPAGAAAGKKVGEGTSDIRAKKDIQDWDPASFLDAIVPIKFKYKAGIEDGGQDQQYGIAAQDVEKVAPHVVSSDSGIKTIDTTKLVPMLLAALADVNKRLKKVE